MRPLRARSWLEHFAPLPPLICREDHGPKCSSQQGGLPYFFGLRSKDDDDNEIDSCYCDTKEQKLQRAGILKYYETFIYLVFSSKQRFLFIYECHKIGGVDCGTCPCPFLQGVLSCVLYWIKTGPYCTVQSDFVKRFHIEWLLTVSDLVKREIRWILCSTVGHLLVCSWRVNFCWEQVVTPGLYLMKLYGSVGQRKVGVESPLLVSWDRGLHDHGRRLCEFSWTFCWWSNWFGFRQIKYLRRCWVKKIAMFRVGKQRLFSVEPASHSSTGTGNSIRHGWHSNSTVVMWCEWLPVLYCS